MNELSARLRMHVIDTLDLIGDEQLQRNYQTQVPDVNVSNQLFNWWEDWYQPSHESFVQAFDADELEALSRFDSVLNEVSARTPQELPPLDAFIATAAWQQLSAAARTTRQRLK